MMSKMNYLMMLGLYVASTEALLQGSKQQNLAIDCTENGLVVDPSDCQQYYSCWANIAYGPIRCSDGLLFSSVLSQCDYAANVNCGGTAAPTPAPAPTAKPTTAAPVPTAKPTTAAPTVAPPPPTGVCKTLNDYFASKGINPDKDIFYNTDLFKWSDICTVIERWNEVYPNAPFMSESSFNNNLLTFAAFFGNAFHESAKYTSCEEKIQPCTDWFCSSGYATDYEDDKWCAAQYRPCSCYQTPHVDGGSFTLIDVLPENACGTTPTCTSHNGEQHTGPDCWYGRGMLQLTWNCNYAKVQRLLEPLNMNLDICADPTSICDGGASYFAPSLGYWMMNANKPFMMDHRIDTAMNCIKAGCDKPFEGTWTGPGAPERREEFERIVALLGAQPAHTHKI